MIHADNHIHTRFSPDGEGEPESFVLRAIELGLKHIAFTEHVDLLYADPTFKMCDLNEYFSHIRALQSKYSGKIDIAVGLEIGYTEKNKFPNAELIEKHRPDYIINSVHEIDGKDLYFPEYFADKTPKEAVERYLEAVSASLDAPYPYHTVGHLGYVGRKSPYRAEINETAPESTDAVLKKIISKGKILELNTSTSHADRHTVTPRETVLRYTELGGKKLCFASDAHRAMDLCRDYESARSLANDAGISEQTIVVNGEETTVEF